MREHFIHYQSLQFMKKLYLTLLIVVIYNACQAQVLTINKTEQEQDQWCWAACSKAILDYYGYPKKQCEIAEWVRTVATFYNFGSVNCCTSATQGCNYWNYNYSSAGSIQDILVHFGAIQNIGLGKAFTEAEIQTEIQNNRLFVIRWGWSSGGGHFVVGHGINAGNVYFMDPWFGEGLKIGTYNYVKQGNGGAGGNTLHTWTHTNKITSYTVGLSNQNEGINFCVRSLYNPAQLVLEGSWAGKLVQLELIDVLGKVQMSEKISPDNNTFNVNLSALSTGLYFVKVSAGGFTATQKIVLQ